MWADRRAPSAPTWLLILALHAGVLALLNTRPGAVTAPRDWSELRLIPVRQLPEPATVHAVPAPAPRTPQPDVTAPAEAMATTPAPPTLAEPTPVDAPAIVEPPAPLRLTQPSLADAARHQPALDDPRGNTPVSNPGQRLANDLGGDGRWVEERMDADFVRLRRGNTCINLHRNRTAGRQPFDESASPTPWGATPAYRCERR